LDEQKLIKLINKGYLEDEKGRCKVVIPRHQVTKGNSNIRVVWNLTKNGVNATVLSPYFFLCTIASLCRLLEHEDDQGDFDIKEQYHNYLLHVSERAYHGVIIPPRVWQDKNVELSTHLMRFTRFPFGWGAAAYLTLRMFARALELVNGNPQDMKNPFHWQEVVFNLPSALNYDPGLPRVRLVRHNTKRSAEIISFFDDGRVHGPAGRLTHTALHKACTGLQYLGNQIALRKNRFHSSCSSAWNGGCVYTDKMLPRKFLSQIKWDC
jgi:hypothetical protein